MTIREIENTTIIISEKLGVDPSEVTLDKSLTNDLGADSLDIVELMMECEKEFNLAIDFEKFVTCITLGDIFNTFFNDIPREYIDKIDTRILCIRIKPNGKIEVVLKFEDGSWCYADGTKVLPSSICLLTFSRWSNILKELEEIINDPNTKEADLQKFFETYPELIAGDDYDVVLPQAVIVKDDNSIWKSDFILSPKNQYEFSKVLELKIPQINIVNRPHSGHTTFSAKVWNAIQQVRDYSNAFDSPAVRERFKKEYNIDVFKPDLQLFVGRRWDIKVMDQVRMLQKQTPVRIEDWDTVLDRLKRQFA